MASQTEANPRPRKSSQTRPRSGAALLVIALALGGLFLILDFYGEQPNYYQPARASITDARMILSQTYGEERVLQAKLKTVHHQLDNAIDLLRRAASSDPADKREIETLQLRLRALEDPNRMATDDSETLKRGYRELIEQLNTLANRLAQPNS